ncbi:MAG: DUF1003 domain-containing protein [Nannocystaceae bacterium]
METVSPPEAPPEAPCLVCGRSLPTLPVAALRPSLAAAIAARHPGHDGDEARICHACLGSERGAFVLGQLERERGDLSAVEAEVSRRAADHLAIAAHLDTQFRRDQTLGQRVADRVASVGGSWPFVIGFGVALAIWIAINSIVLRDRAFDPYPYILLNLALSCLAAIQAPIIMMSQNRAAARDRLEADEDYKVNLKAELEIAALHEKIDHLLHVQWERMVEIQQTQLDLLAELSELSDRR